MSESALTDDERTVLYAPYFDSHWYLSRYPDVASWTGPLVHHFVLHGEDENRDPNSFFSTHWVRNTYADVIGDGYPFATFLTAPINSGINPLPCIDIDYVGDTVTVVNTEYTTATNVLSALMSGQAEPRCEWFSASGYFEHNPDVRGAMTAHEHFLAHGLQEGRLTSSRARLIPIDETPREEDSYEVIDSFLWNGQRWIVVRRGPSAAVLKQIDQQGAIDPRVWSPGADAVAGLEVYRSTDLMTRLGVDVSPLIDITEMHHDVVIILPSVGYGGSEKYFTWLAAHLVSTRGWRVTLLTTSDTAEIVEQTRKHLHSAELDRVRVVSVARVCRKAYQPEWILALLLLNVRARWVIVSNSGPGYRALARFGRALSSVSVLTASFFAETPRVRGNPFTASYADRVIDHAHLMSDNENLIIQLARRLSPYALAGRTHVLPQQVEVPALDIAVVELRAERVSTHQHCQVLWFGRWERLKNTQALARAAGQLIDATVTAVGPGTEDVQEVMPNLVLQPAVPSPDDIDLRQFDCMLFTSVSEGMPNAVLEMVSRGIPVIAPRVGGLQETFDETSLWFYDNGTSDEATATAIVDAVSAFRSASGSDIVTRTLVAREQLLRRHSAQAFAANVTALLSDLGIDDVPAGEPA